MISAGNDIVSLSATNVTRTKSPEFYAKIISPREKALYDTLDQNVLPFDHFVWLLWSVKESAYKFFHRLNTETVFTPVKFEITTIQMPANHTFSAIATEEITGNGFNEMNALSGVVVFSGGTLYFKTIIFQELIASTVNGDECFENVYWGIKKIMVNGNRHESAMIREFLLKNMSDISGIEQISLEKTSDDVPVVVKHSSVLPIPVSLSHHHQWVAFSYYLSKSHFKKTQ